MQRQKAKGKQKPTASNVSTANTPQDPDIAYQRTRNGFIEGIKLVKAATEATSFLGPLKAVCEISLLFLETTKAINENTKGLKQLNDNLAAHISVLDEGYAQVVDKARMDQMPDALKDFDTALREYVAGLKDIHTRMDELMQIREKGVKGFLRKITDARVEPGAIADYKQEIIQCTRVFEDTTKIFQIQLEAEVWKMARLGPEQPRPMGTQHKTCLPGTRVPILQEVRDWCRKFTVDKRVFWLCDVGGSGKSTVALTMCEEWDNAKEIVIGRFFFSKNARTTSETDTFCSTIANDIGAKNRTIMKAVKDAKKEDHELLRRGLRYQFAHLVEKPLQLVNDVNIVLVVDAVDECKQEMRAELLSLLLEKLSSMSNLKLFITSRPEPDITAILQGRCIVRGMHFKMHGKGESSNLDDITTYVNVNLARLLTAPQRQQLVERSNGLFIWITTAYLELKKAEGPDAVEATLKSLLTRGEGGDINQIYTSIIRRLLRERSLDVIRKVMGTILTLFEPVSTEALAHLTDIVHSDLESIVVSMQSVFRVETAVEFLHPTFREYLLGEHNSEMRFDSTAMHSSMAISILQTLSDDLKEDICGVRQPGEPYQKNVNVLDLDERLQRVWSNSPTLSYSIRYWGSHTTPSITNKNVANALQTFLETSILYLIELLSLTGQIHLIRNFEEVRRSYQRSDAFEVELCNDAVRLMQRHQTILKESALHVYSSALLFLPQKTKLWTVYGNKYSYGLPKIVGPASEHWPSHRILAGHKDTVCCVAFTPDGSRIASGSQDKTLRFWDATTGACIAQLEGHTGGVLCLAFSPDGLQIISGSHDSTLRLWNATTGASIAKLEGHTARVKCLAFSPNGLQIASGSDDHTLRLWDATTGACIAKLEGHTNTVHCLAFSPDGLQIASGSIYSTLRLWDGASIAELEGHTDSVLCLGFSPDGDQIASGSMDKTLRLWDATTGVSIAELKGHTRAVVCLAFSPDGLHIASGSYDTTLRLWDATTGASIAELEGHTGVAQCLAFSPDGLQIVSGSLDKTLRLWDAMISPSLASLAELDRHTEGVLCLAFSPDGLQIASGSCDNTLRLWDASTGASIAELKGHTEIVNCLAFSPDGLRIASGSYDNTLRLWDATSGGRIAELRGHSSAVVCLAFSPDGLQIASGSTDRTLRLWNATTGASIAKLEGHTARVTCLAFSLDGLQIASGSDDNTLRLWNVVTTSSLGPPCITTTPVYGLNFIRDGRSLQLGNGTILDTSHGRLQPATPIIAYSTPRRSNICIDEQSRELWCLACPHRKYSIPQEIEWQHYAIHQNKVAFGLTSGHNLVVDFTDVADS